MQVHISIGENHRFTLREALLIYGDERRSFVTRHQVRAEEKGPPSLGPAKPLTSGFLESLVRKLHGSVAPEVLPEAVLAKTDSVTVWWTPARQRQMFYQSSTGACSALNGRVFLQPSLVWRVADGSLSLRALAQNKRPVADTVLAFAPFWNLSADGRVCLGTMRSPHNASVIAIPEWEQGFYESAFTHSNVGRLTRHPGGYEALWAGLANKKTAFPSKHLIMLPQTLAEFVRGERSRHADHPLLEP